jgi:hypothetical protein
VEFFSLMGFVPGDVRKERATDFYGEFLLLDFDTVGSWISIARRPLSLTMIYSLVEI